MTKHRVFISYHHTNDQNYKNALVRFNQLHDIFIDESVHKGDIDDNLDAETIRTTIRDESLKQTTVTILLVGRETHKRKHVDWEVYSSMRDGIVNKKSGILVINLPHADTTGTIIAPRGQIEKQLYPNNIRWSSISNRTEYEEKYPYMPPRIIDNLVKNVNISVVPWNKILNYPNRLYLLIDLANKNRANCNYDFSRPMRRKNS